MNFEFVFQYPSWYILLCLLCGVAYAFVLYRKNHGVPDASKALIWFLAALRFLSVSILCFLLFAPLLRLNSRELEKPVILFLQDNTESVTANSDSVFVKQQYPELLQKLADQLGEKYDFKSFSFDHELQDSLKNDFSGKETDISSALTELSDRYENVNIGAVILATDGIYNKGNNPLYNRRMLNAPVYTVAMGDTTIRRDLFIAQLRHNQLAYLNNTFPVQVTIQADKLKGKSSRISIKKDGVSVASEEISISEEQFLKTIDFQIKAEKTGVQRYSVVLENVDGETSFKNNTRDFFIEIIDSRQKVLILAASPHPDVAAIRQSLIQNRNYEVEVKQADAFSGSVKPYSLVILHQLPSAGNAAAGVIAEAGNAGVPLWFIAGASSQPGILNSQQKLLQINGARGGMNDVYPILNPGFALFTLSDELREAIRKFGPLQIPYGNYIMQQSAVTLFSQRIGAVSTQYPLFVFSSDPEHKQALLAGEGMWRWRLQDFAEHGNHELFDELVSKVVQYLSVRNERKNLRVIARNSYNENERIRMDAEVYNSSYELINQVDVNLVIKDEKGLTYPFTFARTASAYSLDLGMFRAGSYSYAAKTKVGDKEFSAEGRFIVKPVETEKSSGRADHAMLRTMALRTGGEMVGPQDLLQLTEKISKREDVKPVSHIESTVKELVRFPWIFALILLLLSIEWFVRKRSGGY
ncbi:MAG: hypothetical protein KDC13_03585 [Bacteroidetes bacterium]|nr:hypothetical protein [Bacteroidota bacterium]